MKVKSLIILFILTSSLFATCVQILNFDDDLEKTMTLEYCDNDKVMITLKNPNKFLDDYTEKLTLKQFDKLISSYEKVLEWSEKAKMMKIDMTKYITIIPLSLTLAFNSRKRGDNTYITLLGLKSPLEKGAFSLAIKWRIRFFIKQLKDARKNGPTKYKKVVNEFK